MTTARFHTITRRLAGICIALLCVSCQNPTAQRLLKAKPAKISPFLDQRAKMRPARERVPFHFVWRNPDTATQVEVMRRTEIYIAPVSLSHLRPVSKKLAAWEMRRGWTQRREREIAAQIRDEFARAFLNAPAAPRFRVVTRPTAKSVTLEIAVTEINPTSVRGNMVKLAAKFTIGPASALLGVFTKGNIAIEGKVSLSGQGTPVFQFADNEKDKMTFYSARDFQAYAHATMTIKEWAREFEEFTRTYGDHKVRESSFITLKPW